MKYKVFIVILLLIILPINVDARSGCCSHHGGVSHCDTSIGKYRCNDGTVSPSCVCEGIVQTTKRKTTKKQTTARPSTKRTTIKTTTTGVLPTTTNSSTSYPTTITTTIATESISSTTTVANAKESQNESTSDNTKKDNQNNNEDISPAGVIGGVGSIGAIAWYVAKKKKLV